jgi:shikimate dehydrogenase
MKKFAVFGNPIAQSISPSIHQHFAQQAGIEIEYSKCLSEEDTFKQDLKTFFSDKQVIGCNVTAPFKEQAFAFSNYQHTSAKDAGASNTLHHINGRIEAHNTDGAGLVNDVKRVLGDIQGANVLLLGAGGAARGVVRPLLNEGIGQLTVANRTLTRANALAQLVPDTELRTSELSALAGNFDIVINSTSTSLTNNMPELGALSFKGTSLTYDMSYKAKPTAFLQYASEQGSRLYADGLGMLIGQAAVAFTIWTGFTPNTEDLLKTLRTNMYA